MKKILMVGALLALALPARAMEIALSQYVVNAPLVSTQSVILDMSYYGADNVSFGIAVSSTLPPTSTFRDGSTSTNTLTVVSTQPLVGIAGSDTLTVASTNYLTNAVIKVNGTQWANNGWRVDFASNTAIDIAAELNQIFGLSASTTSSTVVTIQCSTLGSFCNANTLSVVNVSSTSAGTASLTVGGATFTGGQNPAVVNIAGYTCSQGTVAGPGVWTVGASVTATAINVSSCITNTSGLNSIVTSTNVAGVVFETSTFVGANVNYSQNTNGGSALTTGAAQFFGGAGTAFSLTTDVITITSHGLATGEGVLFSTGTNSTIAPLVWGTTYYAIAKDANNLYLATSSSNALTGLFINLTSSSTAATHSFTLTPVPLTGAMQINVSQSNDGTNFTPLTTTVNGVSITPMQIVSTFASANAFWDLSTITAKYIRLTFLGPTTGQENVTIYGFGKRYKW